MRARVVSDARTSVPAIRTSGGRARPITRRIAERRKLPETIGLREAGDLVRAAPEDEHGKSQIANGAVGPADELPTHALSRAVEETDPVACMKGRARGRW